MSLLELKLEPDAVPFDALSLLGDRWQAGEAIDQPVHSTSPCQRQTLLNGNAASAAQVDFACQQARTAFPNWRRTPLDDRIAIVKRYQQLVQENSESLALLISMETGKPLWESRTEAAAVAGKVDLSITALQERRATVVVPGQDAETVTRFKPHGVMAVLGPFNFPAHLPNGHLVPAVLAGNTAVFKPSELTPAVGQWMALAWQLAGLPPGVLNLVQGGRATGSALIEHAGIDGLLFTGSSNAGASFHRKFGPSPDKILALEMGGNNPLVVGQISDPSAAVYQILLSAFLTSGQRCTCARRLILIDGPNGDAICQELVSRSEKLRVGFYDDAQEPFMGPVISPEAGNLILNGWETLIQHGGRPLLAPTQLRDCPALLTPGIIEMPEARTFEDREWFGPLLQIFRVPDLEAAIRLANDTRYGLSAGLLSDSSAQWNTFIEEIRAGVVNWNRQTTGASGKLPFGGCGLSGNHRPSGYYAADYCSFPVASIECESLTLPATKMTGLAWD